MSKPKEVVAPAALPVITEAVALRTSKSLKEDATGLVINSPETVSEAAELVKKLNAVEEKIDEEEAKMLTHLKAGIATEKARWKPMRDFVAAGQKTLREGIMSYRKLEEARIATETEKVNKAVTTGRIKNESTAIAKVSAIQATSMGKTLSTGSASASFKTVHKLKVVDASKIPRAYMTPALKLIEAALKAGKSVPGCIMAAEEQLAIK